MKPLNRTLLFVCALLFGVSAAAEAHITTGELPLRLLVLRGNRNPSLISLLSVSPASSLSTKSTLLLEKIIVENGIVAGKASILPSQLINAIPSGGQLEGDIYFYKGGTQYVNLGEYDASNISGTPPNTSLLFTSPGSGSTTPGFANSLTFSSSTSTTTFGGTSKTKSGGAPGVALPQLTGSAGRLLRQYRLLTEKAVGLGEQLVPASQPPLPSGFAGGTLVGGEFTGTYYAWYQSYPIFPSGTYPPAYRPFSLTSPTPVFVFAFGNNPLNNPAGVNSTINIANPSNFFTFANQSVRYIKGGGLALNLIGGSAPTSPFGAYFALGNSPYNTRSFLTIPILSNPLKYLLFY